jgi:hypothetical protein
MDQATSEQRAAEFYEKGFGGFGEIVGAGAARWTAEADQCRTFAQRWALDGYVRRDVNGAMGTFTGPLEWGPLGGRKSFSPNGKRFDFNGVDRYTLRGAKVRAMRSLYDPIEVAQQHRLAPASASLALRLAPYPQAIAAAVQRRMG